MPRLYLVFFVIILMFTSCAGKPEPLPEDISPDEIIRLAQESVVNNAYDNAIFYYKEFISRFPDLNQKIIEAQYEIAFIHYKQNEIAKAKAEFLEIKQQYAGELSEVLPEWTLILTDKILAEIEESEKTANEEE